MEVESSVVSSRPWLKEHEFKPGQSGNPGGRIPITDEERAMRENFRKAFIILGTKTTAEIEEIAKDPNQPAPYAMQAKALYWFLKNGSNAIYKEILDRTLGPVQKEPLIAIQNNISSTVGSVQELTDAELREKLKLILAEPK